MKCPFLFLIDFEMKYPLVFRTHEIPSELWFNFNGKGNRTDQPKSSFPEYHFEKTPISREDYRTGFNIVMDGLKKGDSFLANLTFPTQVETSLTMEEIYSLTSAKYKLKFFNEWVVFSPETFVTIENGTIATHPMKGTIDASIKNAREVILNDRKEMAEHNTVIDLLRNDLSRVARNVHVSQYRYIDHILTHNKNLLQVSSTIQGNVKDYFNDHLGELLIELLPAGSVSGAPKEKTCQIIKDAEGQPRGYYTGVAAYYDGNKVDSCVLIRYIEKRNDQLFARSGGGITFMSCADSEYKEMIDKVYVPVNRDHKDSQRSGYEYPMAQPAV